MGDSTGKAGGRYFGGRAVLLVLSVALALTACRTIYGIFGGGGGPVFPHQPHVDEGMDCDACHPGALEGVYAGLPGTTKGCMLCHKDIDKGKPRDKTVAAFVVEGRPAWASKKEDYSGSSGDVKFSHAAHADADVECSQCHPAEAGESGSEVRISGGKPECLACHDKTAKAGDCSVCHKVLRKDAPPPSHGSNWTLVHGSCSRDTIRGTGETTCSQCHKQTSCDSCHQETKPASHKGFWRRRGHGLTASIDRTKCAACHTPDYCARCHSETKPFSHRGSFGPPRNLHCVTCHLSGSGNSCGVCHKDFPAHEQGPTRPANSAHETAVSPSGCLECHTTLPHPVPSGDCRFCHK